jgi:photosystem II stability/assembly factor-like uncharacterized protein
MSIYIHTNVSIEKSSDGSIYTTLPSLNNLNGSIIKFLVYSENLMFIIIDSKELYKSNGQTWEKVNFTSITKVYDIKYNGRYILVGGNNGRVAKSSDGSTWNEYIISVDKISSTNVVKNIGWNKTKWMAMLTIGTSISSSISNDGVNWTSLSSLDIINDFNSIGDIHYYNENWVYVSGSSQGLWKSQDNGNTWIDIALSRIYNFDAFLIYNLNYLESNNNVLLIGSVGGYLYKTIDLVNFTSQNFNNQFDNYGFKGIKNFNNEFYLFGKGMVDYMHVIKIYKSSSGDNFSLVNTISNKVIYIPSVYNIYSTNLPVITSITSGNGQLTVFFTAPPDGSLITNYKYSIDNGISFYSMNTTSSPYTITGLNNGTEYNIVIVAVNSSGDSSPSNTFSQAPYTIPSAPTSISVIPGNGRFTLNFNVFDGGSRITSYKYSLNNQAFISFNSKPFVITSLTNGTSYDISVKAVNIVGDGNVSTISSQVPYTIPGAPSITSITSGNGQLTINFIPPSDNGGFPIIGYEYSINDQNYFTNLSTQEISNNSFIISSLTNGETYKINFRSINSTGTSVFSKKKEKTLLKTVSGDKYISSSSTGQYVSFSVYGGYIYISSDYGNTWTQKENIRSWISISVSSSGQYQSSVVSNGYIYISSDYGNTWTQKGNISFYNSISVSSSGQYQSSVVSNGYTTYDIYI